MMTPKVIEEMGKFVLNPEGATSYVLSLEEVKAVLKYCDRMAMLAGVVSEGPMYGEIRQQARKDTDWTPPWPNTRY